MPSSLSHSGTASAIAASLAPLLLPSEREQVRLSSSLPASLSSTPPQSVPTKSRNDLFTLDWSPVTPNLSKGPLPPPSLAPLAIPPRPARPPQLVLPPTPPLDSHYLRPPSSSSPKPRSYTQTPSRPPLARQHEPPPDDEAGSSSNPILDTRQSPRLRLSPTKEYHLGEGRHASVYLASYIPLSPAPSSSISRTPSSTSTSSTSSRTPWTLCAAKRIHPDRDSQLAGLGEAFVLSRLASSSHHILGLYGVKDERNGIEEIEAVSRRSSYGSAAGARRQASFQARVEMVPPLGSPSLESGEFGIPTQEEAKMAIRKKREEEINVAKRGAANVWITEMRFARRAEGIKQARSVFTKARKSPFLAWQVYEASATMELLWNNEPKIATNIFELGLKSFSQDPEYILQYLDFLIRSNNPNNARALFERTVALVEPAKAKPVWDRMSQYEYQYGDFLAAQKIFQRYSEAFPEASPIERFAQRHGYLGLDDAITQDLGLSIASTSRDAGERRSRSPSPRRLGPGKRGPSVEPRDAYERGPSLERAAYVGPGQQADYGAKRLKQHHPEGSPAPSSTGGGGGGGGYGRGPQGPQGPAPLAGGWGRAPREEPPMDDYDLSRSGRRRPLDYAPPPHINRPVPYALDSRSETVAILPDAVVFFLSILPGASSFNGPMLNPASVVDVIGTTMLPGTAPGPGLPGERLGIPPRPKPPQQSYGGGSPRRGGGGGGGREPDYGYGGRDGGRGGGGGGGQRPRY